MVHLIRPMMRSAAAHLPACRRQLCRLLGSDGTVTRRTASTISGTTATPLPAERLHRRPLVGLENHYTDGAGKEETFDLIFGDVGGATEYVRTLLNEADYTARQIGDGSAADTLDASSASGPQLIQGGSLIDTITASGHGDVVIAGGYGSDVDNLGSGADVVAYRYDTSASGGWKAEDGSDDIRDFVRGTDRLALVDIASSGTIGDSADLYGALPAVMELGNDDDEIQFILSGFDGNTGWSGLTLRLSIAGTQNGQVEWEQPMIWTLRIGFSETLTIAQVASALGVAATPEGLGSVLNPATGVLTGSSVTFNDLNELLGGSDEFDALNITNEAGLGIDIL